MMVLAAMLNNVAPSAGMASGSGAAPVAGSSNGGFAKALGSAGASGEENARGKSATTADAAGEGGMKNADTTSTGTAAEVMSLRKGTFHRGLGPDAKDATAAATVTGGDAAAEADAGAVAAGREAVTGKQGDAATAKGARGSKEAVTAESATGMLNRKATWNNLKRKSLAAEAEQELELSGEADAGDAAQAKMAAENTGSKAVNGTGRAERKEEGGEGNRKGLAAEAADGVAALISGQFLSGSTTEKAGSAAAGNAETAAVNDLTAVAEARSGQQGALAADLQEEMTAGENPAVATEMNGGKSNEQKTAAAMQQPMVSAFERASFYATGPAAPGSVAREAQLKGASSQQEGKDSQSPKLEGVVVKGGDSATPGKNDPLITPQGDPAKGATEGAQKDAAASAQKGSPADGHAPAPQPETLVQVKGEPTEGAAQPAAAKNDPKGVEGFHRLQGIEKGGAEQAAAKPVSEGSANSSSTPVAHEAKVATVQGAAGQNGSGTAGEKGHSGQNAQDKGMEQMQAALSGTQTPTADAPQEAKGSNLKSALHESIMSQVKDGIATHNAKGDGQISIRLNPGELGELKIQVRMEDNRLMVEVQADNQGVKDLLMSNLDSLKDALSAKNFTMAGFDVSSGGGGFNSPLDRQNGNPQQQASAPRFARGGGYSDEPAGRPVRYVTADVNSLLDVRF